MNQLPGLPVVAVAGLVLTAMCAFRAIDRPSCPADVAGNIGWGLVGLVAGYVTYHLILIGVSPSS